MHKVYCSNNKLSWTLIIQQQWSMAIFFFQNYEYLPARLPACLPVCLIVLCWHTCQIFLLLHIKILLNRKRCRNFRTPSEELKHTSETTRHNYRTNTTSNYFNFYTIVIAKFALCTKYKQHNNFLAKNFYSLNWYFALPTTSTIKPSLMSLWSCFTLEGWKTKEHSKASLLHLHVHKLWCKVTTLHRTEFPNPVPHSRHRLAVVDASPQTIYCSLQLPNIVKLQVENLEYCACTV